MSGLSVWVMLVFFLVVTLSHILEGITGFGSTALSLPLLTALMSISLAKPVLMLYVIPLSVYVLSKSWRQIDRRHFLRMICVMALGVPIGIMLYSRLPEKPLLGVLAAFTIVVSLRGLILAFGLWGKKEQNPRPQGKRGLLSLILVWLGGVIHGAFASGGPLLVIYAAESIRDKGSFRATMCMTWLTVNTLMLIEMGLSGELGSDVWRLTLRGLPFLAIGTYIGDRLHSRVKEKLFSQLSYGVLLASGIFVAVSL